MSRHTLAQATRIICGDNHGLKDPQRWVLLRLRRGEFPGLYIGRKWFMEDHHIEAALETCSRGARTPGPVSPVEVAPAAAPPDVLAGLSERAARRRLMAS